MSPAERGANPGNKHSEKSLRRSFRALNVTGITKLEIDRLIQRPRVADFILNSTLPLSSGFIRILVHDLDVVEAALAVNDKKKDPEEMRKEGREDLGSSRVERAFTEEVIRKVGPEVGLIVQLDSHKTSQKGASEKIGVSKVIKREGILNPVQEVGARAANMRIKLFFRLGVMPIDKDNEKLKEIYEKAMREGWDLSGKIENRDKRLVNAIFNLYADMQKNSEMQIAKPVLRKVVRKLVRSTDQDVQDSYRAQQGMGAKMTAQEYD